MMDYPEIHWKPPETAGRFPDFFSNKKNFEKKNYTYKKIRKPAGNRRGRFSEVSG